MKLQFGPFLIIGALLSTPLAWSQAGSSDSTQSSSTDSSQQQSSQGPQSVFTHPEELPPLAMLGEVTSNSFINLGLGVGTALGQQRGRLFVSGYSRTSIIVNPSIQLRQTRPTLHWYLGGYARILGQQQSVCLQQRKSFCATPASSTKLTRTGRFMRMTPISIPSTLFSNT